MSWSRCSTFLSQEAFTKDNAGVTIDAAAFFQILQPTRAVYEVSNLYQALLILSMTNIRTVVGSMDLYQMLSHRDEINDRLLRVVDAAAEPWGVKVTRVEIKDILPPSDLSGAMARQMKAEREKRAAILAAEGRERQAQAEARATEMVSTAISEGNLAAANFLVAEKYIGALRSMVSASNQKVVIVPVEAAGLAGTLGGIAELTRAVFSSDAPAKQNSSRVPPVGKV